MTEPSPFYRQHVAIEAPVIDNVTFRPFWRIRTHIDQLLTDKAITLTQWRAYQQFRTLVEIVNAGEWRTQTLERLSSTNDPSIPLTRRADAARQLTQLRDRLGVRHYQVLLVHVIATAPWHVLARPFRVHPKTMRRWTIIALQRLAAR
jgi:hypothetical protein